MPQLKSGKITTFVKLKKLQEEEDAHSIPASAGTGFYRLKRTHLCIMGKAICFTVSYAVSSK